MIGHNNVGTTECEIDGRGRRRGSLYFWVEEGERRKVGGVIRLMRR